MSLILPLVQDSLCTCGFVLWRPIARSELSSLGLYDDARFPGRSILRLNEHYESLEAVPNDVMSGYMKDIKTAMTAIKSATGAARVNVAILGNRDPHVHAHLIPRFPAKEEFPDCSPWNDPRQKEALTNETRAEVMNSITDCLALTPTR